MIADVLWAFPTKGDVEDMEADELMAWHGRAIRAKQRDKELMQAAMTDALVTVFNAMRR